MICQQCQQEGKRSTVSGGHGTTTLMASNPYWGEDGVYHNHDPNWTTIYYHCSNGHSWTVKLQNKCPSCDFGKVDS